MRSCRSSMLSRQPFGAATFPAEGAVPVRRAVKSAASTAPGSVRPMARGPTASTPRIWCASWGEGREVRCAKRVRPPLRRLRGAQVPESTSLESDVFLFPTRLHSRKRNRRLPARSRCGIDPGSKQRRWVAYRANIQRQFSEIAQNRLSYLLLSRKNGTRGRCRCRCRRGADSFAPTPVTVAPPPAVVEAKPQLETGRRRRADAAFSEPRFRGYLPDQPSLFGGRRSSLRGIRADLRRQVTR